MLYEDAFQYFWRCIFYIFHTAISSTLWSQEIKNISCGGELEIYLGTEELWFMKYQCINFDDVE